MVVVELPIELGGKKSKKLESSRLKLKPKGNGERDKTQVDQEW